MQIFVQPRSQGPLSTWVQILQTIEFEIFSCTHGTKKLPSVFVTFFFLTALLDNIKVYIPIFMLLNFRPFCIDA